MYDFQKKKGLTIKQSNLCSEIILPTDSTRTAVCCLSSLNLEYYDEWKDNDLFIKDVMEMLDNALTIFIEKAPPTISRAVNSAKKERSIGIVFLGFHSFLQQKNIPFESDEAAKIKYRYFLQNYVLKLIHSIFFWIIFFYISFCKLGFWERRI